MGSIFTLIKNKYKKQGKFKLRSAKKAFAIFALFLITFLVLPAQLSATSLEDQIKSAEKKLQTTQGQKTSLAKEISRFNNEITLIEGEIYKTNLKIGAINKKIELTKKEIVTATEELEKLKSQLGELIRVMYEEGQTSQIEIIARSGSFSEYVNRSEYLEQVNLKVKQSSDKVLSLKNKLESQKRILEKSKKQIVEEKNKQLSQRSQLASTRSYKNQLLTQTKGQEAAYQKILKELYAKRAALAARSGEVVRGGGTGGYPYANNCWGVDPWYFYMCQCTSYAAWNWNKVQGKSWTNTRPGQGNAHNWPTLAGDQGYTVSTTPTVGSIVVWPLTSYTPYGHVAIVTAVYGSKISVAEYNWTYKEAYSTRDNVSIMFYGQNLKFIR